MRLRAKILNILRAAIVESGFLSTVTYTVPYNFFKDPAVEAQGSLIGIRGLGRPQHSAVIEDSPPCLTTSVFAKSLARIVAPLSGLIILPPLLFSSCSLTYRIVDFVLVFLKATLGVETHGEHAGGSLAMFGVYGMIFLQAFTIGSVVSGSWTLYYILCIQLGAWKNEGTSDLLSVKRDLAKAHPDLAWKIHCCVPHKT